jgi:hypothetical protein
MALPIVEIIRIEESDPEGTFGVLRIGKMFFCATLEPPDLLNAVNVSCIPAQQYQCKRYRSSRFGETFVVRNVPGRVGILFHAGNKKEDTAGCILLGESITKLRGERWLRNSGDTFEAFMQEMNGHDLFHLTIYNFF